MCKVREKEEFRMTLGFLTKDIERAADLGVGVGMTVQLGL